VAATAKTRRRRDAHAARVGARDLLFQAFPELVRAFREHNLMTYASALSFQVITSIVPFLLFGLGLVGFLSLDQIWTKDLASQIKPQLSPTAFKFLDESVRKVVTQKDVFWVTAGFALALWEVSGGIRTIMGALDAIHDAKDDRTFLQRMRVSLLLALAVSFLVLAAIAVAWLGPLLYGNVPTPVDALLTFLRWAIAAVLLSVAVGLTIRFAPDSVQPTGWVSFGTGLTVGAWIIASLLFGLYIRFVASYDSVFGNLATVVVLCGYIYISSIVFFAGVQVDAIIRLRVEGNTAGR
jgi:membrane protein